MIELGSWERPAWELELFFDLDFRPEVSVAAALAWPVLPAFARFAWRVELSRASVLCERAGWGIGIGFVSFVLCNIVQPVEPGWQRLIRVILFGLFLAFAFLARRRAIGRRLLSRAARPL